jgi:hypothetical protein
MLLSFRFATPQAWWPVAFAFLSSQTEFSSSRKKTKKGQPTIPRQLASDFFRQPNLFKLSRHFFEMPYDLEQPGTIR